MSQEKNSAAPPAEELVGITIDGTAYQAPKGKNLLHFMLDNEIEISFFCYHPGLSVVAVCRQCLVEINKGPKLVPACQTMIGDGMEVVNNSDRVLDGRRMMLEFILVNHPVDCPICDKAGECTLQKMYMDWDHEASRIDHAKVVKPKRKELGPRILIDNERCILCSRCVRFSREVSGEAQLVIAKRGQKSLVTAAPGRELDSPYSLNVTDLCPVGALTDRDFRFKCRVWELYTTQSICNGCATGCELEIHHKDNEVIRMLPRRTGGEIINNWMCDFGRYTYKALTHERLLSPLVGGADSDWDRALEKVAKAVKKLMKKGGAIGVALGADVTNEDNFAAARLAFDFLELDHVYLAAEPKGSEGDDFLRDDDPNPNLAGATACGRDKIRGQEELEKDLAAGELAALLVIGDRLHLSGDAMDAAGKLELLAVQATHTSALVKKAHAVLPAAMWAEVDGTITNRDRKIQRMRAGVLPPDSVKPHWQIIVQIARRAGLTLSYDGPRQIFDAMKQELDFLQAADWGKAQAALLLRYAGSRG